MCIDLVLADPHPVMLDGLSEAFHASPDFSVKACVSSGDAALAAVQQLKPDILVMDLSLAQRSGLSLFEELQSRQTVTQSVVFTGACMVDVMRVMDMGVLGLVSKDKSKQVLADCIRAVYEGHRWLDCDLTLQAMSLLFAQQKVHVQAPSTLTPRELTVARMATEGWPNKKIASKLCISEGTAKLHLHHIYQKLNCPGRMALQRLMQGQGGL